MVTKEKLFSVGSMGVVQAALRKQLKASMTDVGQNLAPTDFISTGLPSVDYALGRSGIACGKLTLIRGEPSVGKSSLLYYLLAETQRRGGVAVLFETELGIERSRLETFGVNWDELIRVQPSCVEECIDLLEKTVTTIRDADEDVLVLIGWDSVAATSTRKEIEGDSGDASMGSHSRLISQGMRKLIPVIARHRIALVIVNQFRLKMNATAWGEQKTMLADLPLRFHASAIIDAQQIKVLRTVKGTDPVGADIKFDISKNKLAPPRRTAVVPFMYKTGFDVGESWLSLAEKAAVVKKTGGWYTLPDGQKLQSRTAAAAILADTALQDQIIAAASDIVTVASDDEEVDE